MAPTPPPLKECSLNSSFCPPGLVPLNLSYTLFKTLFKVSLKVSLCLFKLSFRLSFKFSSKLRVSLVSSTEQSS